MHHCRRLPVRRHDDINVPINLLKWPLQHIHRENGRTNGDIARPLTDAVRGNHSRARIAFRRAHGAARHKSTALIQKCRPLGREFTCCPPCHEYTRQDVIQLFMKCRRCRKPGKYFQHTRIVRLCRGVDREHARCIVDAEHLFAGQLPMDIAGERRHIVDLRHMHLARQQRLIEVRHTPPFGNVERKRAGKRLCGLSRRIIPPRPKRNKQISCRIKSEIPVHHSANSHRCNMLNGYSVPLFHTLSEIRICTAQAAPDLILMIGPIPSIKMILPRITPLCNHIAFCINQNGFDPCRAQLDAQKGLTITHDSCCCHIH